MSTGNARSAHFKLWIVDNYFDISLKKADFWLKHYGGLINHILRNRYSTVNYIISHIIYLIRFTNAIHSMRSGQAAKAVFFGLTPASAVKVFFYGL